MIRRISFASLMLVLSAAPVYAGNDGYHAQSNGRGNPHDEGTQGNPHEEGSHGDPHDDNTQGDPHGHDYNGNGHKGNKVKNNQNNDQSQAQNQEQAQNQLQGQLQGQEQTAVGVGLGVGVGTGIGTGYSNVNVDSSDNSEYRFPVNTAAALAASHCPNGGASAQWDKFGFSLGQHRDAVCARLDYKASLLAENAILADVARLISRIPTDKDPKSPTNEKVANSIAGSISDAITKNNVRVNEQNDAIEKALKPGWFDWMNEWPVLCVLAPNR